jgi:hypothetical protein
MNKEQQEKLAEQLAKYVPMIEKFLHKKAHKLYSNEIEEINFVLSCAINLVGNMSMHYANGDLKKAANYAELSVANMMVWFEKVLGDMKKEKEMH